MQKIPVAQRRVVEKRYPRFVRAVRIARLIGSVPVETSLDEFEEEDMAVVYACLWLAFSDGVDVKFVAPRKQP